MIKKIVAFSMLGLCLISLALYLGGVRADTLNDMQITTFLHSIDMKYQRWSFKIPTIPKVPTISKPSGSVKELITAIIWIANMFIAIINFLIMVVNFVTMILNTLIAIVQFVLTLITSFKDWLQLLGVIT